MTRESPGGPPAAQPGRARQPSEAASTGGFSGSHDTTESQQTDPAAQQAADLNTSKPSSEPAAAEVAALTPAGGTGAVQSPAAAPQDSAPENPARAPAPQNPVLSAARMMAARIAGQRAPQTAEQRAYEEAARENERLRAKLGERRGGRES